MTQRTLNILFAVTILGLTGALITLNHSKRKTGYIEIQKVYNEFRYKKELEIKLQNTQQARKLILDSLALQLKSFSASIGTSSSKNNLDRLEAQQQQYLDKVQAFEKDNQAQVAQYNDQIMKELNKHVQNYGEQNNYTYIFGAEGSGTLMHAEKDNDITEEMIEYVNANHKEPK